MTGPDAASGGQSRGSLPAVLLVGAAAILPLAALSFPAQPLTASTPSRFAPSPAPMVLTRELRRPLPGGIVISSARSYEITIVRDGGGYRIDGELVGVSVDVPRQFEALAALERARSDTGMFPMRIDDSGRFIGGDKRQVQPTANEAGRIAQGLVPTGLAAPEARDAGAFIRQSTANPVLTSWPDDLFRPAPGKHRSSQVVALPGGKTGEVVVEIEAAVDPGSGLVTSLQREVTTRLGDSTRVTIEIWTLATKP